jgi:hypothetical protein
MTDVRALPIPGHVAGIDVAPHIRPDGSPGLFWDSRGERELPGGGAWHGIELYGHGAAGAVHPFAVLDSRAARQLGELLARAAQTLDAAEEAQRGHVVAVPCSCSHFDHHEAVAGLCAGLTTDYRFRGYCADCRDPDTGTQWTHTDGRARLAAELVRADAAREEATA